MAIRKEILDELIKDCKNPEQFYGPNGLMKQLTKAVVERMMEAELTEQLGYEKSDPAEKETTNRRNGKTAKTLRTDHGPMEIEAPRDRDGEFDPQVIPKHQREFRGSDDKILSMCGLGLSTKAIQENIKEIYGVDISPELVSRVTDEGAKLVSQRTCGRMAE